MRSIVIAAALVAVSSGVLAQEAPAPKFTFGDVMRTCGAEWRESDQRKATPGRDAWNAYRAECIARKGFGKTAKARTDFVRVPDKAPAN